MTAPVWMRGKGGMLLRAPVRSRKNLTRRAAETGTRNGPCATATYAQGRQRLQYSAGSPKLERKARRSRCRGAPETARRDASRRQCHRPIMSLPSRFALDRHSRSTRCWKASARSLLRMEAEPGQAGGRSGRSGRSCFERGAPRARRTAGPEPADRFFPVPGADRRRQDRTHQDTGRRFCSMTIPMRWCGSICPSLWRNTLSHG